jgi:microcin C transport system substrate-binding protein
MRIALALLTLLLAAPAVQAQPTYGLSLLGAPKLPADFTHFPYVNPDAPKGGTVVLAANGTFDSFNPFVVRGSPAAGIGMVWDSLLANNADEASTMYAHLAQSVEIAPDHLSVAFTLRPEAHFNDGTQVTAEDVAWTFRTLREKGRPTFRAYYADVSDVTVEGDRRVVFHFKSAANRELPMILGQIAILPEHWWKGRDFSAPLTEPPLGSGPYKVDSFDMGRTVTYRRVPDWWAANLPTGRGLHNFDAERYEYFRDPTVTFEAFKAGQVDFRVENVAKQWATGYDFPAVTQGLVKKELVEQHLPTGMQAFAMNTRRPVFHDRRVREALVQVFDFEWMNKNLFYNNYTRTESYFSNSDFASSGVPTGAELALLEPFRAKLPPELFTQPFKLPVTDGSGNNREGLKRALELMHQAGWEVRDRKLVDADGNQMSFEILLNEPAFERVGLPYVQSLQRLGIDAHIRTIDAAQFQKRMDELDYDMAITSIPESESLGNEQTDYWTCGAANQTGTSNIAGVCDPAVDALVAHLVAAKDYDDLVTSAHALDRVLLWGWYMVPQWHLQKVRLAYWNRFGHPAEPVRTGVEFNSWWVDKALAAATDAARASR